MIHSPTLSTAAIALMFVAGACSAKQQRSEPESTDRPVVGEHESAAFAPSAPRAYAAQCAIHQPCEAPQIPKCEHVAATEHTVAGLLDAATPVDGKFYLDGTIDLANRSCTDGSPPAECGDECQAALAVVQDGRSIVLQGSELGCEGDDSGVCCTHPLGVPVTIIAERHERRDNLVDVVHVSQVCER